MNARAMNIFAERLSAALQSPLPGWNAHSEMINYPRPRIDDVESLVPDARQGAVLALIYPKNGELHTVLTLRHSYNGHHSGQVSFPGGKCDDGDRSTWHTALREAHEEVGLEAQNVQELGMLSKVYIPPSNFLVHPHVAFSPITPQFSADPVEVKRIIEAPLSQLLAPHLLQQKPMHLKVLPEEVQVKYFALDGETVWGATGMMLNELKHILTRIKGTSPEIF